MAWSAARAAGKTPLPCSYHTATEFDGKMFVFGGKDDSGKVKESDLYILNTAGMRAWNLPKVTGVHPPKRYGHSAARIDKILYVFGGCGEGNHYLNDMTTLKSTTLAWAKPRLVGSLPAPRAHHSGTAVKKQVVVFGGVYLRTGFNDVNVFDSVKNNWTSPACSGTPPSKRYCHAAAEIGRAHV